MQALSFSDKYPPKFYWEFRYARREQARKVAKRAASKASKTKQSEAKQSKQSKRSKAKGREGRAEKKGRPEIEEGWGGRTDGKRGVSRFAPLATRTERAERDGTERAAGNRGRAGKTEKKEASKEASEGASKARKGGRKLGRAPYKNCHIHMGRVWRIILRFGGVWRHFRK